jgi:hypothetical protein
VNDIIVTNNKQHITAHNSTYALLTFPPMSPSV